MRKLNKKQKTLIKREAIQNSKNGEHYMYIEADKLRCYDELNNINCFENMDYHIQDAYQTAMEEL